MKDAAERLADGSGQAGAAVQMTALGPQDVYLTSKPSMSYWRSVHKQHTPFAIDTKPADFFYGLFFDKTVRVDIPKTGDLLGDVIVELRLPALRRLSDGGEYSAPDTPFWTKNIGYVMFRRMRLVINDTVVHDQERLWYDICDKMFGTEAKQAVLDAMIGGAVNLPANVEHTLYVPLKFLCCRDYKTQQQFVPLAALAGASVYVEFEIESLDKCLVPNAQLPPPASPGDFGGGSRLLCDMIVLDRPERAAIITDPTVLMFESQQDMEEINYRSEDRINGGTSRVRYINIDLQELNHPVKALVFVAYREPFDEYFEYLDVVDTAVLMIGPDQRFSPQKGGYFRLVQPYQTGLRALPDNVHAYSFCLDMASTQPCGSVNFSALDRPQLRLELASDDQDVKVKVFAVCIRWLRCHQGQAALLFV